MKALWDRPDARCALGKGAEKSDEQLRPPSFDEEDELIGKAKGKKRNSLAGVKMADVVMMGEVVGADVTEAAIAMASPRVCRRSSDGGSGLPTQAPAKEAEQVQVQGEQRRPTRGGTASRSLASRPPSMVPDVKKAADATEAKLTLSPEPSYKLGVDWTGTAALLASGLVAVGHDRVSVQAMPADMMDALSAAFGAPGPHPPLPRSPSETADNHARRHKVQRDPRYPPVLPRGAHESEECYARRLLTLHKLADMRGGAQRVLVLPQQASETALLADSRLDAQAGCPSVVLPMGPHEPLDSFEARLEAVGATPRPAAGEPRHAPVLPRAKAESERSFHLRLEVAPGCSAVVLPQTSSECDADVVRRLRAQREAPRVYVPPFEPTLETHAAFVLRCDTLGRRTDVPAAGAQARPVGGGSPRRALQRAATTSAARRTTGAEGVVISAELSGKGRARKHLVLLRAAGWLVSKRRGAVSGRNGA